MALENPRHQERLEHLGTNQAAIVEGAKAMLATKLEQRNRISAEWATRKEKIDNTLDDIKFKDYRDSITPSTESAQLRGEALKFHQERALKFSNGVMRYVEKNNGGMEALPQEMQNKVNEYLEGEEIELGRETITYGECYTTKLEKIEDLSAEEKVQLQELLTTLFTPKEGDLLSLNYDKVTEWREKQAEDAKDHKDKETSLKRVENLAGAFVNDYYNKLTSHIDYEKLDKVYEAVRLHLQYEHGDTDKEREKSINMFFGLSGAGKGTAAANLGIIPFISGTGGMSAPGVGGPYDIFRFATGGFDLAREGGIGVNPALNVLAAGPTLAMRMDMDKNGLGKVPMSFDGFPRNKRQMDSVFKDINPDTVNGLFLSLKPKEAFKRNVNRVVTSILDETKIRPDSIDEIALDGRPISEANFKELVAKYEAMLIDGSLQGEEYLDELTKLITQDLLDKKYETNPNARFMKYREQFPDLLRKVSQDFGISVTEIMTGDLSRPKVAMAIMNLLGIDAKYKFADTVSAELAEYQESYESIATLQDQILNHPDAVTSNMSSFAHLDVGDYVVFNTAEGLFTAYVYDSTGINMNAVTTSGSIISLTTGSEALDHDHHIVTLPANKVTKGSNYNTHMTLNVALNRATMSVI